MIQFPLTVFRVCDGQDFGYDGDKGPTHWGEQYNTCYGKYQSPININSLTVKPRYLPPLKLKGFDFLPNQTTITNNGHTGMSCGLGFFLFFCSTDFFFSLSLCLRMAYTLCR